MSWKNFEKKQDVIVAVVDTGIQHDHPFLKNNIHIEKGVANVRNYGVDFSIKNPKNTVSKILFDKTK